MIFLLLRLSCRDDPPGSKTGPIHHHSHVPGALTPPRGHTQPNLALSDLRQFLGWIGHFGGHSSPKLITFRAQLDYSLASPHSQIAVLAWGRSADVIE